MKTLIDTPAREVRIIDSEDDDWVHGHTVHIGRNGELERSIPWTCIKDEAHKKSFWMLREPVDLFTDLGYTISKENANYLQKIFEEDWVGGVWYFHTLASEIPEHGNDIAKLVLNEVSYLANLEGVEVRKYMSPVKLGLIMLAIFKEKMIDKKHFKDVLERVRKGTGLREVLTDTVYAKVDNSAVVEAVKAVLETNPDKLDGSEKITNWLVGQVMKMLKGKANAADVKEEILKHNDR